MKLVDIKRIANKDMRVALSGQELEVYTVDRIPLGIFVVDMLTGGGIPKGRYTCIWGAKSCFKSTIILKLIGQYLRDNPNMSVLYVDFEQSFDYVWAANFIDDFRRLVVIMPDFGEQGVNLAVNMAKAEDVGLLVIDSVAMMTPKKEAEAEDSEDDTVGLLARLVNKMLRRLNVVINKSKLQKRDLAVVLVNQVRSKVGGGGGFGGAQSYKPGGRMLEHATSMDIRMYAKDYKKYKGITTTATVGFTMDKNKVGLPKTSGEFTFYLRDYGDFAAGDVDEVKTLSTYGGRAGLIKKGAKVWTVGKRQFTSLLKMQTAFSEDRKFREQFKATLLDSTLRGGIIEDEDGEEE